VLPFLSEEIAGEFPVEGLARSVSALAWPLGRAGRVRQMQVPAGLERGGLVDDGAARAVDDGEVRSVRRPREAARRVLREAIAERATTLARLPHDDARVLRGGSQQPAARVKRELGDLRLMGLRESR
jgi:hypothetical protein